MAGFSLKKSMANNQVEKTRVALLRLFCSNLEVALLPILDGEKKEKEFRLIGNLMRMEKVDPPSSMFASCSGIESSLCLSRSLGTGIISVGERNILPINRTEYRVKVGMLTENSKPRNSPSP